MSLHLIYCHRIEFSGIIIKEMEEEVRFPPG
jgi:hypothetical protein